MPTGYTADVKDGKITTLGQFVWRCARNFGALIAMRDSPMDTPITEDAVSDRYGARIAELESEIATLKAMTPGELEDHVAKLRAETREFNANQARTQATERERYEAMLAQAEAWQAPSPDHEGLRKFMVSQLRESIEFDCGHAPYCRPIPGPASDWRDARIVELRADIVRQGEYEAKERAAVASRNGWIGALKAAVPYEAVPK